MKVYPKLRHQALRGAMTVLDTAQDPGSVTLHIADLYAAIYSSPLGDTTRQRLLEEDDLRALASERYTGPWPQAEALRAMPEGSLGAVYQGRIDRLGLAALPGPDLGNDLSDGDYLLQRRLQTHDLHHCILGTPVTVAGEACGAAYFSSALHDFGPAVILTAWMFHAMETPSQRQAIWTAIRFGLEIHEAIGPKLLAMRWEEGWEEPISIWRERVGLTDLLARTPFAEELAMLS